MKENHTYLLQGRWAAVVGLALALGFLHPDGANATDSILWKGTVSQNWNYAGNWLRTYPDPQVPCRPTGNSYVGVYEGPDPVIDGTAEACWNLEVSNYMEVDHKSGTLDVGEVLQLGTDLGDGVYSLGGWGLLLSQP